MELINWLYSVIPGWWYVAFLIWILITTPRMGFLSALSTGVSFSLLLVFLYYGGWFMWTFSLGLWYDTPWDVPWYAWLIFALIGLGSGGATASTIIHHGSDERVSDVTITKR